MARLILFNKPYDVLSQFTDAAGRRTLAAFIQQPGIYPAGRLDRDSEGLLLLTDNGALAHQLTAPQKATSKTYWAQVEGEPDFDALRSLCQGVVLKDGMTRPAEARVISPPALWPRTPPIRVRAKIPTQWIELRIREGRNRQVRRMTAAVGHPTLRLVRVAVGDWTLEGLAPGAWRSVDVVAPPATGAKQRRKAEKKRPGRKR